MGLTIPLPILLPIVLLGVGGTVALVHLLGNTPAPRVEDEDAALARLREDVSDAEASQVVITSDRRAALLALTDGRLALVAGVGDGLATRMLGAAFLRRVDRRPDGLRLRFRDPGFPALRLRLDEQVRDTWEERLRALSLQGGSDGRA